MSPYPLPLEPPSHRLYPTPLEEVKLSLFADDIILYIENPKDATRKLLELINESGRVAG